jgi:quercetin dioxygenase-like cupin family protein
MTYRDGKAVRTDAGDQSDAIRVKALSMLGTDVPSMQYVDYPPGYVDPVHSHDTGEWFIVVAGEMRFTDDADDPALVPGGAVFIPKDTPYAVHAGDDGVRYFRIVVP